MSGRQSVTAPSVRSTAQRSARRRVSGLKLSGAVRNSVNFLFRFTHRADDVKALWSESSAVWLGRSTFLYWALDDSSIDIPWVTAGVADAPRNMEELRAAIKSELASYWTDRLSALPRRSTGRWLPLP